MRKQLVLLVGALLCPALAGAESAFGNYLDDPQSLWLGVGLGGGSINSVAPAPAADRDAFGLAIDAGYRVTPEFGLGFEFGLVAPTSGCGGHHCTPAAPDFAPDFTHWFLVSEFRPGNRGLRMRVGAGLSNMCYRDYRSSHASWESFLLVVVFHDGEYDDRAGSWACKHLHALGASASIGYQWSLPDSDSSVGLQLRAEAANFAASGAAGTSAFHYRAVMSQIQLNIN